MDSSSSCSDLDSTRVSFGNVTIREYERKLDEKATPTLGLTLGWKFIEHDPIGVDTFKSDKSEYREANTTSEGERADILLANGYSRRMLRKALKQKKREDDADDNEDGTKRSMPKSLLCLPSRMMRSIAKKMVIAPSSVADDTDMHYLF
jgi:hypothetical protein